MVSHCFRFFWLFLLLCLAHDHSCSCKERWHELFIPAAIGCDFKTGLLTGGNLSDALVLVTIKYIENKFMEFRHVPVHVGQWSPSHP
jgi:hypothetical protein